MPTTEVPALDQVFTLAQVDPEYLDDASLVTHIAQVNTIQREVQRYVDATNMTVSRLLVERICRTVEAEFPTAVYLEVCVLELHFQDENGKPDYNNPAEPARLAPGEVLDVDKNLLGTLSATNPVRHYLEQLTPFVDLEPSHLCLADRSLYLSEGPGPDDYTVTSTAEGTAEVADGFTTAPPLPDELTDLDEINDLGDIIDRGDSPDRWT